MRVKRPKNVRWCHPEMGYDKAHRVQTGDSFVSLASKYGFSDPWDIIRFNYGTKDPEEVNWYLQELVGCTKSKDGINYSFDSSDKFGILYIPPKGWKAGPVVNTDYSFAEIKMMRWNSFEFNGCPYVQPGNIATIFNDKIFLVGDPNLKVWAEYDYGNIIYMRLPKNPRPTNAHGSYDTHWLYKEMIHLAYGAHGMNMAYSLRTEAVALVGAMVAGGRDPRIFKGPFEGFSFPGVTQTEFFAILDTFLAQYKKSPSAANLEPLVRLVQRHPYMTRRLHGAWSVGKAA